MTTSLPHRNTGGSVSDDEAIPDTDPSDVSTPLVPYEMNANSQLRHPAYSSSDFKPTSMLLDI